MKKYEFPKIDLHLHLDGSFRLDTIWELKNKYNIKFPKETKEEYNQFLIDCSNSNSVNEYLKMFDDPLKVMQDEESLERITYELIEDIYNDGLIYAEIRFAPQLHTQKNLSQEDAIKAVLKGKQKALEKYDINIGIIACMMCVGSEKINWEQNKETLELCNKYKDKGIDAIDLAGAEGIVPLSNFKPLFDKAYEYGLNMTCHAGDSQHSETVSDAISFNVTRIGHGHHIIEDLDLCNKAIEKNITLEICPTSNVQCKTVDSYEAHPIKKLYDMGVKVSINTDNRTLARVSLDDEYDHCINEMGFEYNDLIKMNINSINSSFINEDDKNRIREKIESYYRR